jgi:hypothetical protein
MVSARSTESIARTTPAQKPRGEHKITFNAGFWPEVFAVEREIGSGMGRSQSRFSAAKRSTWGPKPCPVKRGLVAVAVPAGVAYIPATSVIADDTGFARKGGRSARTHLPGG